MIPSWDNYFLEMLEVVKKRSPDEETQVACILTEENKIVGVGYNGFPKGIDNLPTKRPAKYPFMVHADLNAILNCKKEVREPKAYITHLPCNVCLKALWNFGVKKIVVPPNRKVFSYSNKDYRVLGTLMVSGLQIQIDNFVYDYYSFERNPTQKTIVKMTKEIFK